MKRLLYVLIGLSIHIGLLSAQVSRVTGVVKSAEDDLPIIGATVLVEGTGLGTVTDWMVNLKSPIFQAKLRL